MASARAYSNGGLDRMRKKIRRAQQEMPAALQQANSAVGEFVKRQAVLNAPISPTKTQYIASLKTGKLRTKSRTFNPGSLQNSIHYKATKSRIRLIAQTPYAQRMERSRYNLGPGSRAKSGKGHQVGRQYLRRSVEDRKQKQGIHGIYKNALKKLFT